MNPGDHTGAEPPPGDSRASPSDFTLFRRITPTNVIAVLVAGFALVILLLVAASFIGFRNTRSIQAGAAGLLREQLVTARLINKIQVEQDTLNAVFFQLTRAAREIDPDRLLKDLNETDEDIARVVQDAAGTPEHTLWQQLELTTRGFSAQARRFIQQREDTEAALSDLFRRHESVSRLVSELLNTSSARASAAEAAIGAQSGNLFRESSFLLGASVLLALACALLTVRITTQLFRSVELHAAQLSRVSWHMLHGQEAAARRFSHELHDELGQSLAAVKANLVSLTPEDLSARRADCLNLVDEAINNVRELSQLLRPVILDDFGLDAGLSWLTEKFTQRTGIQVDYASNLSDRLDDTVETDLFRITQEALTNVARHSGATQVRMRLESRSARIYLRIEDNGRGISGNGHAQSGLGMVGMRARAQQAGGEFTVRSTAGQGVLLDVWVPTTKSPQHATEENPHSVG